MEYATKVDKINKDVKPIMLFGIGEKTFGGKYPQGNRVYDSNAIAVCLGASPVGHLGGYSSLYVVYDD